MDDGADRILLARENDVQNLHQRALGFRCVPSENRVKDVIVCQRHFAAKGIAEQVELLRRVMLVLLYLLLHDTS